RETGRVLEIYTDTGYAVESRGDRARRHAGLLGVPFEPRGFDSLPGRIVRAQWLVAHEEAEAVIAETVPGLHVTPSYSPVMPDTTFVNLTPSGVDKATAVRAVAAEYGVPLERVMLVGDGSNDAPAMREVGFPVAMGNAEPEAREAARYEVGHVDEGGLAEALALALVA
ncbi:MAG: HAD hydrolase family protein, partial [Gemmatimonadota bacterium]|nr:HAD hydrolase family protein [Gemmatimonadota bacterium]